MIESKYLKENIENIQKLMAIPALKNFETKALGKLQKDIFASEDATPPARKAIA